MTEIDCVEHLAELDARGEITRAIEHCEESPYSENSKCQRYLGWAYANRHEFEKAAQWYLRAATQGDVEAIEECWAFVQSVDALGKKTIAMEFSRQAPLSQHLTFQRYLAKQYFEEGNIDQTLHWSLKIADHGGKDDLLYVGELYLSQDKPEPALDFLKRAASAGSARAHQLLGEMYGFGIGVTKDTRAAASYYQESANKGYLLSQVRLLHLKRQEGGFTSNLEFAARLPLIVLKGLMIKACNPSDPRVADIPVKPKP
jgi:TPR repeat protein